MSYESEYIEWPQRCLRTIVVRTIQGKGYKSGLVPPSRRLNSSTQKESTTRQQGNHHILPNTTTMYLPAKATLAILMALLPTVNSYIVAFFTEKGCDDDDWGTECGDIDSLSCCAAPAGRLYVSVGHDANWGYSLQNDDSCGVVLGSGDGCYSVDSGIDAISGGSVVGIAETPSKRSEPPKVVKADTWFYRNGTDKYTLPIDSDNGRLFDALKDRDVQRDFITTHGKFTRLEE
ncbi:hypothetical protein BDW62DRAFT_168651 [Aspergillus aurantiobrunneus]